MALLLCACIDWDAERRAALCLKQNVCDAGGAGGGAASTGGGTANGGGSGTTGGGSGSTGGGSAPNGGGAAAGGGTALGGGSAAGGGIAHGPDCTPNNGIVWCALPGNSYVPDDAGHPSIRLADCGNGHVCFCSNALGDVSPQTGVYLSSASFPYECSGIGANGSSAWIFDYDDGTMLEVVERYDVGSPTVTSAGVFPQIMPALTGGAALALSDGGWYLLATGTSGAGIKWVDYALNQSHSFNVGATRPFVYEPVVLPDQSGVLVPYFDDPNAGVVFIGKGGTVNQPYDNPSGLTPRGRTLVAVTQASVFVGWQAGAGLDIFHFTPGVSSRDGEVKPGGDDLVGLVAADDQSIFAVSNSVNAIDVFKLQWDGGFSSDVVHLPSDAVAESIALLPGPMLAFAAICQKQGGICDGPGHAFIGFYVP
jgi:hypothetical protein